MMYGIGNEESSVQELGGVETFPGRLLAFPNVMQHKVSPFELEDKAKPGHRKILVAFLVDPHIRVISTANVPPQRQDWWSEEMRNVEPLADLPEELFDMIMNEIIPVSWDEAVEYRQQLMDERGLVNDGVDHHLAAVSIHYYLHNYPVADSSFRIHFLSVNIDPI
jgi:hypothetical protein